jgi:L-ascorbate metabolism protein UlaG (beta-lactamase superfamily)
MKARYWTAISAFAAAGAALAAARSGRWRRQRRDFHLHLPAGAEPPASELGSVLFVGTATAIIRFGGMTILTDPNFLHRGEQVHIGYGMHSTRLTDPSMAFEELPAIDFVLLSHLHEDHFDKLVEKRLAKNTPILTTVSAARVLRRRGFTRACGLRTWDGVEVRKGPAGLRITAMPGTHGPMLVSAFLPDVMGSMLEFSDQRDGGEYRMYISGDTLVFRDLLEIPRRYPNIDLALLHLGGTRVLGVLVTMDAAEGVRALRIVSPELAIPIHYDDYDVFKDPLENFTRAVKEAGLQHKVQVLRRGEAYSFAVRSANTVDQPTYLGAGHERKNGT